jgi:hypothetical protein
VLERGAGEVAGVEVKEGATVTAADFRGLHKLKNATSKRFAAGVVLYRRKLRGLRREASRRTPSCPLADGLTPRPLISSASSSHPPTEDKPCFRPVCLPAFG